MKKIFTLSFAFALCASAFAADGLTIFSLGEGMPQPGEPQLMGLAISGNGEYVAGAGENGVIVFVAERSTGEVKWAIVDSDDGGELRDVDDFGVAIGFGEDGFTCPFTTSGETLQFDAIPNDQFRYVMGEGINNDGTIEVGTAVVQSFASVAVYRANGGDWKRLPTPTEEEMGTDLWEAMHNGASGAKKVSGDGKVIIGYLGNFGMPYVWRLNDEGEYEGEMFTHTSEIPDNLMSMSAMYMNLSNNGKYSCYVGKIKDEATDTTLDVPIIYDIENGVITVYSERQGIDLNGYGLYPTAIADNGTFIGSIGQPYFASAGSFIMEGGESVAKTYLECFPEYAEKLGMGDMYGFNVPTGISADSRYLLGYTYYSADYNDATVDDAVYLTYVIDRGDTVGVNNVVVDAAQQLPEAIYTLDGRRADKLVKGINIVRKSDGSVEKILVK